MRTNIQRQLVVACTFIFFLVSGTAWATTLSGTMNDYLYCAKDDGKQDGEKGEKGEKGDKGGKKGNGEEEEPDCD